MKITDTRKESTEAKSKKFELSLISGLQNDAIHPELLDLLAAIYERELLGPEVEVELAGSTENTESRTGKSDQYLLVNLDPKSLSKFINFCLEWKHWSKIMTDQAGPKKWKIYLQDTRP